MQETATPTADVKALIASFKEHITTSLSAVKDSDTHTEKVKKKKEEEEKKIE